MWIRSQDRKSLSDVNGILVDTTIDKSKCYIYGFVDRGRDILGVYSTEQKGLKVLGQIQNTISDRVVINGQLYVPPRRINEPHTTTTKNDVIYIMPQDDEVEVWN